MRSSTHLFQQISVFLQIRLGSGNRDFHYTHWTVMVNRATGEDEPKIVPLEGPDPSIFFLDDAEHTKLRYVKFRQVRCVHQMCAV